MNVDLQLEGASEAQRELVLLGRRLVNLEPVFENIADEFFALEGDVWNTAGGAIGERWKPLGKKWAAWKAKHHPGAGILEMTAGGGPLRKSLTKRGAPYQVLDVGSTEMRVGTRFGIAKIHQRGAKVRLRSGRSTKMHEATIPKRQMVKARAVDKKRWVAEMQAYAITGTKPRRLVNL